LLVGGPLLGTAAATTSSPWNPQLPSSPNCPPVPPVAGQVGQYGSVVAFFQPDALLGPNSLCGLPPGGQLFGDQVILTLITTQTPPNDSLLFAVEEFTTQQVPYMIHLGNNTTETLYRTVVTSATWSNTTIPADAGEVQGFVFTVPPEYDGSNITVGIAGVSWTGTIVTPKTSLAVPTTYGAFLVDESSALVAGMFLAFMGFGIAAALVTRVKYIGPRKPAIVLAGFGICLLAAILVEFEPFLLWAGANGPYWIAGPFFPIGIALGLYVAPPRAFIARLERDVAELTDGEATRDDDHLRIFRGKGKSEHVRPGFWAFWERLFGGGYDFDPLVVTPTPHWAIEKSFVKPRADVKWVLGLLPEAPGRPPPLEIVPSKWWWFPHRQKIRDLREDRVADLRHWWDPRKRIRLREGNWLFAYDRGITLAAAVGQSGYLLLRTWTRGTGVIRDAVEEQQRAETVALAASLNVHTLAVNLAQKLQATELVARQFPNDPDAMQRLQEVHKELADMLADPTRLMQYVTRWAPPENGHRRPPRGPKEETTTSEATNPRPPWLRGIHTRGKGAS
jgi:hypothetical protein